MKNITEIERCIKENDIQGIDKINPEEIISYENKKYNENLFLFAIENGKDVEIVQSIVKIVKKNFQEKTYKNFIKSEDIDNNNALELAIMFNKVNVITYLQKNLEFELDVVNRNGESALTWAISNKALNSFKYLLREAIVDPKN